MSYEEYVKIFKEEFIPEFAYRSIDFRKNDDIKKMLWNDLIMEFNLKYPGFKDYIGRC